MIDKTDLSIQLFELERNRLQLTDILYPNWEQQKQEWLNRKIEEANELYKKQQGDTNNDNN